MVPQEISTVDAPVAIEDAEVSCLLPLDAVFGFRYVEDNGDSILIVLTDRALVGGGSIGLDKAIRFGGMLSFLKVGDGGENFGEGRFIVSLVSDLSGLKGEFLGLEEDFLPNDLLGGFGGGFGLGSGLVLVGVFVDVAPDGLFFVNFFGGAVADLSVVLVVAFEVAFDVVFGGVFGCGWPGYFHFRI